MLTREEFFSAVSRVAITGHAHMLDKARWSAAQQRKPTGPDCIRDGIISLILACPESVVADMVLYIDLPPEEANVVARLRTEIRQALRSARPRRAGFRNVRPCPDHRRHGGIIQVADMIAGEVREREGIAGPHLQRLVPRIRLV
jgi:hypothetical protein